MSNTPVSKTSNCTPFTALTCPLDGEPLQQQSQRWFCSAGHSFDVAKQGHVNLLPVQNKRSLDPGDSKDMVAARQRFLNAGFYQPIAAAMSKLLLKDAEQGTLSCLDAGCGEGYYLRQLVESQPEQSWQRVGLDISKWAVLAAAKQDKNSTWIVASNANLTLASDSLDRIICAFGFPVYAEFARVLKAGGRLLLVDAGSNHLRQLREIIYPSLKPESADSTETPEGFTELLSENLSFDIHLHSQTQVADLLCMTPHLYRATAEGRAKAEKLTQLALTVDVNFRLLEANK